MSSVAGAGNGKKRKPAEEKASFVACLFGLVRGLPVADEIRVLELVVKVHLLAVHGQEPGADGVLVVAARFASELSGWRAGKTRRGYNTYVVVAVTSPQGAAP